MSNVMNEDIGQEFVDELAKRLGLVEGEAPNKDGKKEKVDESKSPKAKAKDEDESDEVNEEEEETEHVCPLCESVIEEEVSDEMLLDLVEHTLSVLQAINEDLDEEDLDEIDEKFDMKDKGDGDEDSDESEDSDDDEDEGEKSSKKDKPGKGKNKELKTKKPIAGKPNKPGLFKTNNDE